MALQVPATSRVYIRGLPEGTTEKAVSDYFGKFGGVANVYVEQGGGYVEFKDSSSAEKAAAAKDHKLQGKPIEAKRSMPEVGASLMPAQALVEPKVPDTALDVVVMRGACTGTAIGMATLIAQAKTTVLIIWDRPCPVQETTVSGALEKRVYATLEEERPDQLVMGKAFEFFGSGAPKCALLHVQDDKVFETKNADKPFHDPEGTAKSIASNHIETTTALYAAAIYQPWVHAYRATVFFLVPPSMVHDWPDDLGISMTGTRRVVKADCLKFGPMGWSVGLQLTTENAAINAKLAVASMSTIVNGSDDTKNKISGKNVKLMMPPGRAWCNVKPTAAIQAPLGIKAN